MTVHLEFTDTVRDVEVAVELADGETLALLGPNGSGKSTLLGVLAGLVRPSTGRVSIDGEAVTDVGPGRPGLMVAPHTRRTALLGQEALLFPHLDALENVAFGPRSAGTPRRSARTDAQRWLDEVGVGELSGRRPSELSGGQAQRVAVARALAAEPRVLLLDEPMAALDVAVQPALRQVLRRVLADRTAIVVTHDPLDALLLADRVVVLEAGRVVEDGPSREVLSRPRSAFAARLAGLNLVRGSWRDGAVRSESLDVHGLVEGPAPPDGDPVIAAFRPQAVAVYRDEVHGSPRNAFPVIVTDVEPRADLVRVHAGDLAADITVQAAADLELAPGSRVTFTVKATEVAVYAV
jgi:molybdate transport system ATP-binding protein